VRIPKRAERWSVTSFDAWSVTRVVKSLGLRATVDRRSDRATNRRVKWALASFDPGQESAPGIHTLVECGVRLH
jgi:hypothetical protein